MWREQKKQQENILISPPFCLFFSFKFYRIFVDISWIQTWIIGVDGEHADHQGSYTMITIQLPNWQKHFQHTTNLETSSQIMTSWGYSNELICNQYSQGSPRETTPNSQKEFATNQLTTFILKFLVPTLFQSR